MATKEIEKNAEELLTVGNLTLSEFLAIERIFMNEKEVAGSC